MVTVRTVLGDLPAADLGPTDYHEHLFQASPLLVGDELDSEAASGQEAVLLRESGFTTMVDATPLGLGAKPKALARRETHG
jgi:phosphotriesterase-related protein